MKERWSPARSSGETPYSPHKRAFLSRTGNHKSGETLFSA